MDIIEIFICAASAVVLRTDEIRTVQNFDAAETAGTAAAGRMDLQPRAFQSNRERLACFCGDHSLGYADSDGEVINFILLFGRETFKFRNVPDLAEDLEADTPFRDRESVKFAPDEVVHHLRAADEIGRIGGRILSDDLPVHEALRPSPSRVFPAQDMHDLHLIAGAPFHLFLQDNVIFGD